MPNVGGIRCCPAMAQPRHRHGVAYAIAYVSVTVDH